MRCEHQAVGRKYDHLGGHCFDNAKTGIVILTNSSSGEGRYKELLETLPKNTYTPIAWEGFAPYEQQN
jgi:hypothetical protein